MTLIECSEYSKLKDKVVRSFEISERYSQLLSSLKEYFREDINSPRRYEKITTIKQLLRVLEIRDVLSVTNVVALREIARRLQNSFELLNKINEYETRHMPTEPVYYASEKTQSIQVHQEPVVETSFIQNNPNTGMSIHKKQRIIETIIDDIGISWRDLARGLEIKEKVIDDLNENYKEISQKAKCIMDLYNKKADDSTWFFDLCDALETCRRKELVRKLKKIIVMNI